ncbi:hypothetical protein [Alkalispirochaeta alkalica]|uniref:hypothetical protein n=1 Tax=Alkalispirochaeta alkalica TaxID=46356 RepID=UPI0012FE108B|nr:hypothetical protein [Alkalispirochaeta alkalica]
MIKKLRDQLGPEEPRPDDGSDEDPLAKSARLFRYLIDLTQDLPPDRDQEFRRSDERLKLIGVASRLNGRPTLRERLERFRRDPPREARSGDTPPQEDLPGTFEHIARLSSALPDTSIGEELGKRAQAMSERLRQIRENR